MEPITLDTIPEHLKGLPVFQYKEQAHAKSGFYQGLNVTIYDTGVTIPFNMDSLDEFSIIETYRCIVDDGEEKTLRVIYAKDLEKIAE